jgi:cell division transport system permease protein
MNSTSKDNSQKKVRGSYFISIISVSMVLLMLGIISLLLINAKNLSDYAKENIGFTLFLENNAKPSDVDRLKKTLQISNYTTSYKYVSKEEARQIMKEELGKDFTEILGYNSLPNSIEVLIDSKYSNPDSIESIRKSLGKFTAIKEFYYQKSLVSLVNKNVQNLTFAGIFISSLLLLIAITLINNTIRLSVYSKRFIIRTAQLVGATKNFIKNPFITGGVAMGMLGSAVSSMVLVFIVLILQQNFENIITIQGIWLVILIMFVLGSVITGLAANFAVEKYLKLDTSKLYFEN